MLISNGSALNILLANNNKILNDVLKETDNKTLNNLLKQDTNKAIDAGKILKGVFESIKDGSKTSASLENMLKNSNIAKELGNLSSNIANLLENIKEDSSLQKFKPLLENFLKNIKDMDSSSLKEQIKNSGVFLENKLTSPINAKLENILNNIQSLIKNIDTPLAKEINSLINSITQNLNLSSQSINITDLQNSLKALTTSLQNLNSTLNTPLTQNLSTFVNELKNMLNQGTLVESKLENLNLNQTSNLNTKELLNTQVKELLSQIKNELMQNPTLLQNSKTLLPQIENLMKMTDLFIKSDNILNTNIQNSISTFSNNFASNLNPILMSLKDILQTVSPENSKMQENINSLIKQIENIVQDNLNNSILNPKQGQKFDDDFKSMLFKMQEDLSGKVDIRSQENLRAINNLLTQIDFYQLTSLVSNSNFVYIPFLWEMLEDGSIEMKQKDEEKFFCQIKLTLKDFGKVDLMLALYEENKLDMTIYAQREHFKTTLKDNIGKLKIALNGADIIPMSIRLLDMKEEEKKEDIPTAVYQNLYNQFDFGSKVDIKA